MKYNLEPVKIKVRNKFWRPLHELVALGPFDQIFEEIWNRVSFFIVQYVVIEYIKEYEI